MRLQGPKPVVIIRYNGMRDSLVRLGMLTRVSPRCEIWYQRVVEPRESGEDSHTMREPNVSTVEPSLSGAHLECTKQDDAPEYFRRVRLKFRKEDRMVIDDALTYLDWIKSRSAHQPEVYSNFLDIMQDFKTNALGSTGVIDRVSRLFANYPDLLQSFKRFLPDESSVGPD